MCGRAGAGNIQPAGWVWPTAPESGLQSSRALPMPMPAPGLSSEEMHLGQTTSSCTLHRQLCHKTTKYSAQVRHGDNALLLPVIKIHLRDQEVHTYYTRHLLHDKLMRCAVYVSASAHAHLLGWSNLIYSAAG